MFNKIYDKVKLFILENIRFLICLTILIFVFTFEFPYVVYTPGGLVNLNERIDVENGYDKNGSLNMSYVSMRKGTIPSILLSYVIPNWDLKKNEDVTINDESIDELLKLERIYMTSSVNNATILAYNKAGKEVKITKSINNVTFIADFAKTDVKLQDEFLKADGKEIETIDDLKSIINNKNIGDKINIVVKRNNKEKNCYAIISENEGEKKIGIGFLTTYEYDTNPDIKIKTKASESGSSGGLMLTLAIYNDIVKEDLTKGRKIVGTGTISLDGTVGAIDGVKYKMLGAAKKKADIFLCPEENYEEALKVKNEFNLQLVLKSVKNFDEAVNYLLNS